MQLAHERCPKCNVSFKGNEIPEKDREAFGGLTHFDRKIMCYDIDLDRTTGYMCPDCGYRWDSAYPKVARRA